MSGHTPSSQYIIEKKGWYYRPNSQGYTGQKSEAGRYSFEEAAVIVGPNGPDGSQDGMSMWREADAPEFSKSCPWDVKMRAAAYDEGFEAGKKQSHEALVEVLEKLIRTSDLLQNNAIGCAVNHHQIDFIEQDTPCWLDDTKSDIDKARAALALAKGGE